MVVEIPPTVQMQATEEDDSGDGHGGAGGGTGDAPKGK